MKILENNKKKLIVLTGTTCTGKSLTALNLNDLISSEIISADSMLVYRYFDIGTAKPTKEILTKTKHHLVDIVDPDDEFDAWKFMELSREVIDKSNLNNFIVVGGTQLYIKSLIEGLTFDISKNDDIRKSILKDLELYGIDHLYSKLKELDSEGAAMISSNDKQRIIRYLEINYMTGQRVSQVFKMKSNQKIQNVDYVKVALSIDRESVNTLINQRVDQMIRDGLVQEVVELKKKYNKKIKPFNSIGYKEISLYLNSEVSLDKAVELIKIRTRQFAKRQRTWLRKDEEIKWFDHVEDLINFCTKYTLS
ncbi:tRNA (adenosine(37)-N6)-dimethylallyltransferase MiaA [Desulfobacterota bacterium]|nr:tRNA (adenosine(37)-N6)-dimethylallyltransferase MiaA [Thermodesulfobacteriota bacterium]